MIQNYITLINGKWHNTYSYATHNLDLPIVVVLCGEERTGIKRTIRLNTQESTCPKCQEHLKNGTFVNFIGEIEKI